MFLLAKYTQRRLFDILEGNLIFDGLVVVLNTFIYSIWRIPPIVLNMIAWSFFGNVYFSIVSANDLFVVPLVVE